MDHLPRHKLLPKLIVPEMDRSTFGVLNRRVHSPPMHLTPFWSPYTHTKSTTELRAQRLKGREEHKRAASTKTQGTRRAQQSREHKDSRDEKSITELGAQLNAWAHLAHVSSIIICKYWV